MSDKLTLKSEMAALDKKDRDFYNSLNDSERKKFSLYLMLKYSANVEGHPDLEHYYLAAHNERVNRHFFSLSKHPQLQWLLCTSVSPDMGLQKHYWLKAKSSDSNARVAKFIEKMHPELNAMEIKILANSMSKKDLERIAREHGYSDEQIRKEL